MAKKLSEAQIEALKNVANYEPVHERHYIFRIGRGRNAWRSLDALEQRGYVHKNDRSEYSITPAGREALTAAQDTTDITPADYAVAEAMGETADNAASEVEPDANNRCDCGNADKLPGYRVCASCKEARESAPHLWEGDAPDALPEPAPEVTPADYAAAEAMGETADNVFADSEPVAEAPQPAPSVSHTPAPWTYWPGKGIHKLWDVTPDHNWSSHKVANTYHHTELIDLPTAEANARRIVACVNACEGIPTSQLEWGGLAPNPATAPLCDCCATNPATEGGLCDHCGAFVRGLKASHDVKVGELEARLDARIEILNRVYAERDNAQDDAAGLRELVEGYRKWIAEKLEPMRQLAMETSLRYEPCGYYCDPDEYGGGHHDHKLFNWAKYLYSDGITPTTPEDVYAFLNK